MVAGRESVHDLYVLYCEVLCVYYCTVVHGAATTAATTLMAVVWVRLSHFRLPLPPSCYTQTHMVTSKVCVLKSLSALTNLRPGKLSWVLQFYASFLALPTCSALSFFVSRTFVLCHNVRCTLNLGSKIMRVFATDSAQQPGTTVRTS